MVTRREFARWSAAALVAARGGLAQKAALSVLSPVSTKSPVSIRSAAAARGLLGGCAVNTHALRRDEAYKALIVAQAGIVVAESEFKFGPLRPTPTTYFFDDADYLLEFAEAHQMKLRGHNFVWHRQLPRWFSSDVTKENARQVLVDHIETVGGRYRGKMQSWDVVNEAIYPQDGLPGGFRNSPWQQVLGGSGPVPEYIEVAYRTARRVDPKALLVYNDYGIEAEDAESATKRAAVLGLLRAMQAQKIPLDGLGVQSHIQAGGNAVYGEGLMTLIAEARAMGLKVLITEMDVNDRKLPPPIPERDAAVAAVYASYLKMVLADPAIIAVLTWGITDKYTWLNGEDSRADKLPERPLPFDAAMQPVAAFDAEVKALGEAPSR